MSIFDPTRGSYSLRGVLLRRYTLYVHIHLSSVAFHVLSVGLGFHVVIGVGRLIVRFHHAHVIPSFLLDVVVRLCLVIVNSDCSHNSCMLHIAKTGPLRCCPYKAFRESTERELPKIIGKARNPLKRVHPFQK